MLIYVTGFGPFDGHENKNASWEAVRLLPDEIVIFDYRFQIKKLEIPVVYTDVDKCIEEIWKEGPQFVLHCGVNSCIRNICIEKQSANGNFCKKDWTGKCLPSQNVSLSNNEKCTTLSTNLNVDKMVHELNNSIKNDIFQCSTDVGNYLCGYIYLKSLDKNCQRCLFVHVPPIDKPFTTEETSNALKSILEKCIEILHTENKI